MLKVEIPNYEYTGSGERNVHACSHCLNEETELFYFEGEEAIGYCLECSDELNEEDRFLAGDH